jgi:hypothetical protein
MAEEKKTTGTKATNTGKAKAATPAETAKKKTEKTYNASEVEKMIAEAVDKAVADAVAGIAKQQAAYRPADETVTLLYMGCVAEGSTVPLNEKLGQIQGRGGTRDINKREFLQNLTPNILRRLKDRRLIILDGMTDEERERYGVKYTDGELLGADIYHRLLDMPEEKILAIFDKACYRHKQLIATLFIDAYMARDNRINQYLVQKLNEVSKKTDPEGMFKSILKDMAKGLAEAAE